MANGTVLPFPLHQFFTNAGAPAASHRLFFYNAGTSTKVNVWTDQALSVAHSNPITLNASGRPASPIYVTPGTSLKISFAASGADDPPSSPIWTMDNIPAVPYTSSDTDVDGVAGQSLTAGQVVYMADGTGGTTAGRWYPADADAAASSTTANGLGMVPSDIASGDTGAVRIEGRITGLSGLTAGAVHYISATAGALTSSAPANARAIGIAESATVFLLTQWVPVPDASATVAGKVTTGTQTLAGAKTASSVFTFSAGTIGAPTFSRLAANFTSNADTTLDDVTGLSFAVVASGIYVFDFYIHVSSGATPDFKYALTGPAAPTAVRYGTVGDGTSGLTSSASAFATALVYATNGNEQSLLVHGILRNGANAGTVQFQAAQNTSDASNTIVLAESNVVAWRIS